jgi:hypothetical protein
VIILFHASATEHMALIETLMTLNILLFLTKRERKKEILYLIAICAMLYLGLILFDFTCPRWTRRSKSDVILYRHSMWEKQHEHSTSWYDFDPCEKLGNEHCTDDDEMMVQRQEDDSCIMRVGGGGASGHVGNPRDSAVCPIDECSVMPTFGDAEGEAFRTTTFSRGTWWYKYMWILGVSHEVHMDQQQLFGPRVYITVYPIT